MQDESRSLGDVAIDMDSQTNPLQLQLIDEQVDCWCMFVKVRQMERNVCASFDGTKTGKRCQLLFIFDAQCRNIGLKRIGKMYIYVPQCGLFLKSCSLCLYRTRTSRAVQTPCRILRAPSWSWALYSSNWHTWSRSKRRPSRGKTEVDVGRVEERQDLSENKGNDEMLVRNSLSI